MGNACWELYCMEHGIRPDGVMDTNMAEGFKCTVEGCGESFKDTFLLRSHVNDHNEEMRKAMKCNQAKCIRLQFSSRRDYNEHMDRHKEEAKAKIINSIRSRRGVYSYK